MNTWQRRFWEPCVSVCGNWASLSDSRIPAIEQTILEFRTYNLLHWKPSCYTQWEMPCLENSFANVSLLKGGIQLQEREGNWLSRQLQVGEEILHRVGEGRESGVCTGYWCCLSADHTDSERCGGAASGVKQGDWWCWLEKQLHERMKLTRQSGKKVCKMRCAKCYRLLYYLGAFTLCNMYVTFVHSHFISVAKQRKSVFQVVLGQKKQICSNFGVHYAQTTPKPH